MSPDAAATTPQLLPMDEIEQWLEDALNAGNGPAFVRAMTMALRHPEGAVFKDSGGPVHWLIGAGSPTLLASYLNNGGKNLVRVRNPVGNTPLHVVAAVCPPGAAEMVGLLVEAGAGVQMNNHWGQSPLHLAGGQGQHSMHPNPSATDEDRCALVSALLRAGANPDAPDGLKVPARALINPEWLPPPPEVEALEIPNDGATEIPGAVAPAAPTKALGDLDGPEAPHGASLFPEADAGGLGVAPEADGPDMGPSVPEAAASSVPFLTGTEQEGTPEAKGAAAPPVPTGYGAVSVWDPEGQDCPIRPAAAFPAPVLPQEAPPPSASLSDTPPADGDAHDPAPAPRYRPRR